MLKRATISLRRLLHLQPPKDIVFTAEHGVTNDKRNFLSIIKNQGQEGLCWAYSLASTIEISYALKTGNRLMLDPFTFYNNSVNWWKKQSTKDKMERELCLSYTQNKGYYAPCVIEYMVVSGDSMKQMDSEDSFVRMTDAGYSTIETVQQLYEALDKHGVLYISINSTYLKNHQLIDEYYDFDDPNVNVDHSVVLTAVGKIEGYSGIYVEILNSWGTDNGYDGLYYVKVANNEKSKLINNMKMFDAPIYIEVKRVISSAKETILNIILAIIKLVVTIIKAVTQTGSKKQRL